MYPTIFALGIAELGPLTSKGSGVITIGNVGGAVIPPLFGALAVAMSFQRLHSADHLLHFHRLLRPVGLQANALGCGVGVE
jgi:fucose permease